MSTPAMLVGKATMIGITWYPDIEQTDVLLVELTKIRTYVDVPAAIDRVLDYRRELSLKAQEQELRGLLS